MLRNQQHKQREKFDNWDKMQMMISPKNVGIHQFK